MNKAYGVSVTSSDGDGQTKRSALVVVAADELDAELVAARVTGPSSEAETLRELTADEVLEHGLELDRHGTVKAVAVPNL